MICSMIAELVPSPLGSSDGSKWGVDSLWVAGERNPFRIHGCREEEASVIEREDCLKEVRKEGKSPR